MKILTILGTRPEIIRLSRIIPRLDEVLGRENHILVHTGQNHDLLLYMQFFYDLNLRHPDVQLRMRGTFGEQVGMLLPEIERVLMEARPDRVLILGDTNSSLAAIVAARLLIPVYHMEAGNRSYSPHSPEEVNRRLIDHCSTVLMPYTERSRQNLLAEGIHSSRIFVTGNPIKEVIDDYRDGIDNSDIFNKLEINRGRYFLVTLHREENVDDGNRLIDFLFAFDQVRHEYGIPVVVSTHPRLRQQISRYAGKKSATHIDGAADNSRLCFHDPFGFFDFIALEQNAFCVLSDSGTVQEECCILNTPSVILRDFTERPEMIDCGASVLSGADPNRILALVKQVTEKKPSWPIPSEYTRTNVADTVVRILTSHREVV